MKGTAANWFRQKALLTATSAKTGEIRQIQTPFKWDTKSETISWKGKPFPGSGSYGEAALARNGLIYGLAGSKYYVFDPVKRSVVFRGRLPVKRAHFQGLADEAAGREGLIYGIGDAAVFAIDPEDHSARIIATHPSIQHAAGMYVTPGGVLYSGSQTFLWRARPPGRQ